MWYQSGESSHRLQPMLFDPDPSVNCLLLQPLNHFIFLWQPQKNCNVKTLFSVLNVSIVITCIVKPTTHTLTYILPNSKTICLHNTNFSDVQRFHGDYTAIKPENCSCSLLYTAWTFHLHPEWQGIYRVLKSTLRFLCVWNSNTWNKWYYKPPFINWNIADLEIVLMSSVQHSHSVLLQIIFQYRLLQDNALFSISLMLICFIHSSLYLLIPYL